MGVFDGIFGEENFVIGDDVDGYVMNMCKVVDECGVIVGFEFVELRFVDYVGDDFVDVVGGF